MPGPQCSVGGCTNKRTDHISLHQFPSDSKLRERWISSIKATGTSVSRDKTWKGPDVTKSKQSQMVCSVHFEEECFTQTCRMHWAEGLKYKTKLETSAVPTLFGDQVEEYWQTKPMRAAFRKRECARIISEYDAAEALKQSRSTPKATSSPPETVPSPNASPHPVRIPSSTHHIGTSTSTTVTETEFEEAIESDDFVVRPCAPVEIAKQVKKSIPPSDKTPTKRRNKTTQVNLPAKNSKTQKAQKGTQTLKKHVISYDNKSTQTDVNDYTENQSSEGPLQTPRILNITHADNPHIKTSTPKKKVKISIEDRLDSTFNSSFTTHFTDDPINDPDYNPRDDLLDMSEDTEPEHDTSHMKQRKFIVFEENLLSLFTVCPECFSSTTATTQQIKGTAVCVLQECSCGYERLWHSQPNVGNTPAGNIMLSAAILFSGCAPTKTIRIFEFMNLMTISLNTFWTHQRTLLWPTVDIVWNRTRATKLDAIKDRGGEVTLAGDGRCDSPGHCAKYGSYTVIDMESGKVLIDLQLIQSNQVKGSFHMEKEGLKRCVDNLYKEDIVIRELVTDRHMQIQKWVREELPEIKHTYDVWHVAKAVKKKLLAISKDKECDAVRSWIRSITNHLYWSAASTPEDADRELIVSKWKSVAAHVQNVHSGHDGIYKTCQHGDLEDRNWLKPGTKSCSKVEDMILNKRLCNDVRKLSTGYQTSDLEAFHSVVNHFAPKMFAYTYHGQLCRQHLAAMHFNENSHREQKVGKHGDKKIKIDFPKYKSDGEFSVRIKRKEMTFAYVTALMKEVLDKCIRNDKTPVSTPAPPTLSSGKRKPTKEEARAQLSTRYKKVKLQL